MDERKDKGSDNPWKTGFTGVLFSFFSTYFSPQMAIAYES
jgi:hypothetical protein